MSRRLESGEQHLAFWAGCLSHIQCFVYVIQGDPDSPIKVGRARDVRSRIATLQTGSWQQLRLLYVLPGDHELEWQLHRRLRGCRVIGEWFFGIKVPEVLQLVAETAEQMVGAHDGTQRPPDWRTYIKPFSRPKPSEHGMFVQNVEPNPVDPKEAQRRLAAHWMRPARRDAA